MAGTAIPERTNTCLDVDLVSIGTKTLNFSNQNQTVDNFEVKWPNHHELLTNLSLDWGFFIDVDQLDKTAVLNIGIFIPNELTYRVCPTAAWNRDIDPKNLRGTIWYWNLADVRRKEICMTASPTTVRPNYASRSVVHIGSSVGVYKDCDGALHFMVDDKDLGIAVEKIPRRYYYGWIRIGGIGNVKITHRADLSLASYFRHAVLLGKTLSKSPPKISNQKNSTPAAIKGKKEQKGKKEEEAPESQSDHQESAESASAHTDERAVYPRPLSKYRMANKPRGHCLIISNSRFHDQSRNREGADADEKALKSLFEEMHFTVTIKKNLKAEEMNDLLYDFARKDHQHFDAFVCVIMTHGGDNNVLLGVDDRETTLEDLMTAVKPTNCRSLQGKPKVFIVQACRGEFREDVAGSYCPSSFFASHNFSCRSHIDTNMDVDGVASRSSACSTVPRVMCPIEGDFLLAWATAPGYVALRDPRNGSIFVQVLVDVFRKYRNNYHVLDLLVEVNRRVAERVEELTDGMYWQIPAPTFTLRGVFYFQD